MILAELKKIDKHLHNLSRKIIRRGMNEGNKICFSILKNRFPKIKKHSNTPFRSFHSRVQNILILKKDNKLGIFRAEIKKILERHNVLNELKLPQQKGIPVRAREKIRLRNSRIQNPFFIPVGKNKKHVALVFRKAQENKKVKNSNDIGLFDLLFGKIDLIQNGILNKIDNLKISLDG